MFILQFKFAKMFSKGMQCNKPSTAKENFHNFTHSIEDHRVGRKRHYGTIKMENSIGKEMFHLM